MGRPEPCVLFAQTFLHPQLDEYVDEVVFAEPVVITACEFLEQNASSATPAITLMGATSPPSFALEVFVQSEGETRFRRLCQPFLYSHSSSNVLEVEAVVTNHLVVRGSYRSLSLIIYGNTAEDLGQFTIEVDLDGSLPGTVCDIEGNHEDLPAPLRLTNLSVEESINHPKALSLKVVASDISIEMKRFLQILFKVLEFPNLGDATNALVSSVVSVASSYATNVLQSTALYRKEFADGILENLEESHSVFMEARKKLLEIYKSVQHESGNQFVEILKEDTLFESDKDLATSKELADKLSRYFKFSCDSGSFGHPQLSKSKNAILWLSASLLLCSARESCFHFVNGGGMEQLGHVFSQSMQSSCALTLLSLGVVEQATRTAVGSEGFLGWWPREDENVPSGVSEGYNQLLRLLLQKQRHDVASLVTYILHRVSFYEVASRYENAVLSVLGGLSTVGRVTSVTLDMLASAKVQLKKLLKLINSCGPVEDPSPVALASRSDICGDTEKVLSYKATSCLISSSNCSLQNWDIDSHLLSLLKERGFLPLSAALLSCSILRSEAGFAMDLFVDIASYIEAIILSLLSCRSGLIFLLLDPELAVTIILSLQGDDNFKKQGSIPLRYASVLISKGFFQHLHEVGMIVETHLKAVNAIDHLIMSPPHSEEILWVLWELCGLSRSDCGRQALLALSHFPEAISVLMATLESVKELDPASSISGASPLNLALFHSAAEIFEVLVTDSTASSLSSWVEHAKELHRVLHSSSPGSNRKDAPTRLLEWIDASVVYHKNGATGLLRYAAVLVSGGDAHIALSNVLSSDAMDVESVGDSASGSDGNVIETLLGRPITKKIFTGVTLRESSVAQLTTAFRILAFISDDSAVATALYDEGVIMVVHGVLLDCKLMLERSSNNYDYLVDESTECNSTSDLLLERNREQSLVDLLIPSLVLLINLLKKLQETKEQHRNTKLMNVLLQLHREVSPKLAACVADLSYPYPEFALGFKAVCHLIVSALSCWPLYGWTPSLFQHLLDSLHATSLLALGPKETCSLLCLLNDLFPEEGGWLWKNGMPMLGTLRTLAVGTLLGPSKAREIDWYLKPGYSEKLLDQLTPQLDKIAQIVSRCAISTLVVIQDMLRVFIVRILNLNADSALVLLRPTILWIYDRLSEQSSLLDTDFYKVYRLLDFLSILLEHPRAKPLLLKVGALPMLRKVLERCLSASDLDTKQFLDSKIIDRCGFSVISWCTPVAKSISLICDSRACAQYTQVNNRYNLDKLTAEDCSLFLSYLLRLCKVLPIGRELLACLSAFREIGSSTEGQSALLSIFLHLQSFGAEEYKSQGRHENDENKIPFDAFEWKKHPPLLSCWITFLRSIDSKDAPPEYLIEGVGTLSSGALCFCMDGESLNVERVAAVKCLFGLPHVMGDTNSSSEKNMKCIEELVTLLGSNIQDDEVSAATDGKTYLNQVKDSAKSLMLLLQSPVGSANTEEIISSVYLSSSNVLVSSRIHKLADGTAERVEDSDIYGLGDKFLWECPENLRDRLSQGTLPLKRKVSSVDGASRRTRDNAPTEIMAQSAFSRGSGPPATPSGPTRRDTFRQRKPNTSRPPSMHVDDYVARERNDGTNSNVIAVPRVGSTSGRPPSIHVDEFMARQRERQNPGGAAVSDAAMQLKVSPSENGTDVEKYSKSKQLKPDLDDDLQGIDIVFDAEESESDDKLPFPQPDDNLHQPASVIVGQSSPHSVVEETESDVNENSRSSQLAKPLASNVDENTFSEFSSKMSVSQPDQPLAREPSISSDRKYLEQSEDTKNVRVRTSSEFDSAALPSSSEMTASVYTKGAVPSLQLPIDARILAHNFYPKTSLQHTGIAPSAVGSQGSYDQKVHLTQPPLPPLPPPPTISPVLSQTSDPVSSQSSAFVNSITDVRPSLHGGFHVQTEYPSVLAHNSTSLASSSPLLDSKYSRTSVSSPGGSARPPPPLPPTPPPYAAIPSALPSLKPSAAQGSVYNQTSIGTTELLQTSVMASSDARLGNLSASGTILTSYPPPPLMPQLIFGRPTSMPTSVHRSSPTAHQGEIASGISQNLPISLPSFHSMPSLAQLQPLQPPQLPRPPQPPPHLRPAPQSDQGVSLLQSPIQMQVQSLQMLQQPQVSPVHVYPQNHHQENFPHAMQQQQVEPSRPQVLHQQGDAMSQQYSDAGMSLQHYFSSPEAIQSLLRDRDKLCQLLEQHPKLMQMLQERLGQL